MWIIVDIENAQDHRDGLKIEAGREPTFIHLDRDSAYGELLRLQRLKPECDFVLFQATYRAIQTLSDRSVLRVEPLA